MTIGKILLPIVETVLPYLNAIVKVLQWIFNLIASLLGIEISAGNTGTSSLDDLADSADDATDSIDDTADSVSDLNNQLLGIDELNTLDTSSSSGSDSDSSGSSSSIDLSDAIAEALAEYQLAWDEALSNVSDKATEMANSVINGITSAFESNGFEGVGEYIGDAIANQLKKIDWDKVYSSAKTFGTDFADFLNGLISSDLFTEVAKTIASCLNTAIYTWLSFSEEFDWKKFGVQLANSLNTFFETFDFDALGEAINAWVNGIVSAIQGFLATIKPKDVWDAFFETISHFNITTWNVILGIGALKLTMKLAGALLSNQVLTAKLSEKFLSILGANASSIAVKGIGIALIIESFNFLYNGAKDADIREGLTGSLMSALGILMVSGNPQLALGTLIVTGLIEIEASLQKQIDNFKDTILNPTSNEESPLANPTVDVGTITFDGDAKFSDTLLDKAKQNANNSVETELNNNTNLGASGTYSQYTGIGSGYSVTITSCWEDVTNSVIGKGIRDFVLSISEGASNLKTKITTSLENAKENFLSYMAERIYKTKDLLATIGMGFEDITETANKWLSKVINFFFGDGTDGKDTNTNANISFLNTISDWVSKVIEFFFGSGKDGKDTNTNANVSFLDKAKNWVSKVIEFFFGDGSDGKTKKGTFNLLNKDGSNNWISKILNFFFGDGSDGKTKSGIFNLTNKDGSNNWISNILHLFFGNGTSGQSKSGIFSLFGSEGKSSWVLNVIKMFFGDGKTGVKKGGEFVVSFGKKAENWITNLISKLNSNNWSLSPSFKIGFSFSGLTTGMQKFFENIGNGVKNFTANIISNITGSSTSKTATGGFINEHGIKRYASGGIPSMGTLFWAGEAGAEVVGNTSRGTEVLNESQIAQSIASGVASANSSQNKLLVQQNQLLQAILEKETGISSSDLFNSVRKSAQNYYNKTGNGAFAY